MEGGNFENNTSIILGNIGIFGYILYEFILIYFIKYASSVLFQCKSAAMIYLPARYHQNTVDSDERGRRLTLWS